MQNALNLTQIFLRTTFLCVAIITAIILCMLSVSCSFRIRLELTLKLT